ncbi:MAG: helix-turn-helix domain-containing protein [Methylococcales symbiont of Iophon sp. n. MRB-2018]|nr:MAG: helix-turn-helix domain-containing protein [Methylococcales symbiont of Iophon sp. n. MRB-2018]KAF3978824.1 MAG: helix-turn-helix domain-containing protein [Methylococcales symbiont of Iophon sp. n. MRB-2018]
MKMYTHLTEAQRYPIYLMKKQGFSLRFIAKTMNRSVSI